MYDTKVAELVRLTRRKNPTLDMLGALREVDQTVTRAIDNQRDANTPIERVIGIYQAIDQATASPVFLEDDGFARGYAKATSVAPEVFWARWWPALTSRREASWRTLNDGTRTQAG